MAFDPAGALFNSLDLNKDGYVDRSEFSQLIGNNAGLYGTTGATAYETGYYGGAYGAGLAGVYNYGAGLADATSYEASSYNSGAAYANAAAYNAALASANYGATAVQAYASDAQGLFQDPNPQVIRRPNPAGAATYAQNIRVRFLQPPPVPPHGPLIIKEVRPAQPPVPPPLRLRQVGQPHPIPPPVVLREQPPQPPAVIPAQTVIRRLPGLPVPPRSVIVERVPPLPPRPRDVIIDRWVPYGAQAKRRVLVQRAPAPAPYPSPRNVIIQYEQSPARIVRQFQRLGVHGASPSAYVQQYGASLLDSASLVQSARSAGVVEDISAPGAVAALGYGAATYGLDVASLGGAYQAASALDYGYLGAAGYGAGYYGSGYYNGGLGYYNGGLGYYNSGVEAADAAFNFADSDHNGALDRNEFNQFLANGL